MSKERNYLPRIIAFRIQRQTLRGVHGWDECDMSSVLDAASSSSSAATSATSAPTRPNASFPVFSTPSAAPPVDGLPLRDGAGEQRRGLHEEELPRDARLHEALQPAHHPGGRAHVEVRRPRAQRSKKATQETPTFKSRRGLFAVARVPPRFPFLFFSLLFFFLFLPPPQPSPARAAPRITIPSTDSGSKYGRFVCADSKHLLPDDIDSNLGGFDFRLSEGACVVCTRRLFNLNKKKTKKKIKQRLLAHCFYLFIFPTGWLP